MYNTVSFVYSHDEYASFIEYAADTHWGIPWQRFKKNVMEAGDFEAGFCSTFSTVTLLLIYF